MCARFLMGAFCEFACRLRTSVRHTKDGGGMKRISVFALIAVFAVLTASSAAFGQATASGTVEGTVLDKSQSSISGAEVVITGKATGATRTATTSDVGTFRFD